MKATMIHQAVATNVYLLEAENGEILTNEAIEVYLEDNDLAPFGFYVTYQTATEAEIKAYVD